MLEKLLTQSLTTLPISPIYFLLGITEAYILGLVVVAMYRKRHPSATQSESFNISMQLMAPIVSMVLMFIGSNLALSIGMIGSLSIIRFRTIVKDPLDLMFLFLLIGIGLGCGTQNFILTPIALIIILPLMFFSTRNKTHLSPGILIIAKGDDDKQILGFIKKLESIFQTCHTNRFEANKQGFEVVLESRNLSTQEIDTLLKLKAEFSMTAVSIVKKQETI